MLYQIGLLFYSFTAQPTQVGPLPGVSLMCKDVSGGEHWGHTLWIILQSVIFCGKWSVVKTKCKRRQCVCTALTSNLDPQVIQQLNESEQQREYMRDKWLAGVNSTIEGCQKLNFQFRRSSISSTWQDCGSLRVMLTRLWILTRNNTTQLRNCYLFFVFLDTLHISCFFSPCKTIFLSSLPETAFT